VAQTAPARCWDLWWRAERESASSFLSAAFIPLLIGASFWGGISKGERKCAEKRVGTAVAGGLGVRARAVTRRWNSRGAETDFRSGGAVGELA